MVIFTGYFVFKKIFVRIRWDRATAVPGSGTGGNLRISNIA
jgi:hypothetical protein